MHCSVGSIPTLIFFALGICRANPLLIAASLCFGIGHCYITYCNSSDL